MTPVSLHATHDPKPRINFVLDRELYLQFIFVKMLHSPQQFDAMLVLACLQPSSPFMSHTRESLNKKFVLNLSDIFLGQRYIHADRHTHVHTHTRAHTHTNLVLHILQHIGRFEGQESEDEGF